MTTLAELVAQTPAPGRGIVTGYVYGSGEWRLVVELADPAAGASVQWYDITAIIDPRVFTGYDLSRGADGYLGRYRASVVTLELWTDDDSLAPWNPDTSPTFGTHVDLGPGLLIRAGFIRVDAGAVAEWNPRFTNKVEYWGDSSHSHGKLRQFPVTARDTLTSLVGVPLPPRTAENWSDRMFHFLQDSGWPYGSAIYGAQFTWDGNPILTLPDRDVVTSAVNDLDAICDPTGLVWYTNRLGQLVVRPRVDDTFHDAAFRNGATGDQWPGDVTPVDFVWYACQPPDDPGEPTNAAAYAIDTPSIQPFGFDKDETNIINHVKIAVPAPGTPFDDDDPVSIQRYDRKTYQASWLAENDTVAAQILKTRANSIVVARPLHTTARLPGFFPGPATIDYLGYAAIQHKNYEGGAVASGNGWLSSYREQVRPLGCDIEWLMTLAFDIYAISATPADEQMRPVENLRLAGVSDWEAEFRWDNPPQPQGVIPTHTQVRIANPASLWQTIEYPVTDLFWGGLAANTPYEFQVRLVSIDPASGQITDFSPQRQVNFTTALATKPNTTVGDDNLHTEFPIPDSPCFVHWILEQTSDGLTWTLTDQGNITTQPFTLDYDTSTLDPAFYYRFTSEEICGGQSQGPVKGHPFPLVCKPPAELSQAPYNSGLVAYWPKLCGNSIEEAVSGQPMQLGNAFDRVDHTTGDWVMWSFHEGHIGVGNEPTTVATSGPLSIAVKVMIGTQPTAERMLFAYGGAWISITPSGSGYRLRGNVNEASGGHTFIQGASVLTVGVQYDFTLTHDPATGNLRIYLNADEQASALGSVGNRVDPFGYSIQLPASSWITDVAVWNRVLAVSELPGYDAPIIGAPTTFEFTGAVQHYTVPAGCFSMRMLAKGAQGGGSGGTGNTVEIDHPVTPGQVLDIYVGGTNGWPNGGAAGNAGAFNGFTGGGSSDVRASGAAIIAAFLIAPGGGGHGESSASNPNPYGGPGGYLVGGDAQRAKGATQTAGGDGLGGGAAGTQGKGGDASSSGNSFDFGGGGGGGGWWGGEGGQAASPPAQSGGGGASGHVDAQATNIVVTDRPVTGNGQVVLTPYMTITSGLLLAQLQQTAPDSLWNPVQGGSLNDLGPKGHALSYSGGVPTTFRAGPGSVGNFPLLADASTHCLQTAVEDYAGYSTGLTVVGVMYQLEDFGGDMWRKYKTASANPDLTFGFTAGPDLDARTTQAASLSSKESHQVSVTAMNQWFVFECYYPPGDQYPIMYVNGIQVSGADLEHFSSGVRGNNGAGIINWGGNTNGSISDALGNYAYCGIWLRQLSATERANYRSAAQLEGWIA